MQLNTKYTKNTLHIKYLLLTIIDKLKGMTMSATSMSATAKELRKQFVELRKLLSNPTNAITIIFPKAMRRINGVRRSAA